MVAFACTVATAGESLRNVHDVPPPGAMLAYTSIPELWPPRTMAGEVRIVRLELNVITAVAVLPGTRIAVIKTDTGLLMFAGAV
jgi:hypothetical protein